MLLGLVEPGGRLPTSWPATGEGLPSTRPANGVLAYDEGLFVGCRAYDRTGRAPLYRFGHGLGYTTWDYRSVDAPTAVESGTPVTVAVRVRNAGARPGGEVVQVYASGPSSAIERPVRWLAGFARVEAAAGEEVVASVTVPARAFEHWDEARGAWAVEPGAFRLEAGRSSGDLSLATSVELRVAGT